MRCALTAVVLASALSSSALAVETYLVEMSTKSTHMQLGLGLSTPLAGSFRGDYDAATNPGGTMTRPGVFGGSGNIPIPYTSTVTAGVEMDTVPTGSMKLTMSGGGLLIVSDLQLDMLGGDHGDLGVRLGLSYSTFRTFNPNALYPGVPMIEIPIPLGEITEMSAVQTANAIGVMEPDGKGVYKLFALVPANVSFRVRFLEQVVETDSFGILLPVLGSVQWNGETMDVDLEITDSGTDAIPVQLDPLVDQPLDLPTVLPPGGMAHLLFSGDFGELTLERSFDMLMVSEGQPTCSIFDLDGNCEFDGGDLAILLASWGQGGPADFNGDGIVNQIDLAILLSVWGS